MGKIKLTKREYDVLSRLTQDDISIADELGISIHTVRHYIFVLNKKLNTKNRTQIVLKAIQYDLIDVYNFKFN